MSELPPSARALFAAARREATPNAARLEAIKQRIGAAVAAGATPTVDEHLAVSAPASRPGVGWLVPLTGAGVLALMLFALHLVMDRPKGTAAPARSTVVGAEAREALPPSSDVRSAQVELPSRVPAVAAAKETEPEYDDEMRAGTRPAPDTSQTPRTPTRRSSVSSARAAVEDPFGPEFDLPRSMLDARPVQGPHAPVPAEPAAGEANRLRSDGDGLAGAALAREVALITEARGALARGQAHAAQALLDRHRTEFPAGQLMVERAALAVHARCAAGDAAGARRLFGELVLMAPRSSLRRAAERACAELWSRVR